MRKLILFLLVFVSAKVSAQVYQEMPQYGYRANRMAFDSTLQIPTVCGVPTLKSIVKANKNGAIAYDSCNAKFYVYNPKTLAWSEVSGGGGGATDTTSLSNRINLKLDKTDTASLSNRINLRVPYTGATQEVNLGRFNLTVDSLTIGRGNNHSLIQNTALGFDVLKNTTTGNYNTGVGHQSLHNTTTGQYNTAIGQSSLFTNTTGGQNTAIGLNALLYNLSGGSNVALGVDAFQHNTTGGSNTAIGYNAGSHITNGSTPNTTASNSVFIGRDSKASADGQSNQIVIGYNAIGNGSNTVTMGNTSTTANYFTGSINGGSFVKSGGTSSQFLKANGSIDATTYLSATDSVSLSNRINLKLNIADTSNLQPKSIPAYSILANNTSATANATAQIFKQFGNQTYSDSITITGASNPSGAINHSFRWSQIGNLVTLHITLTYATVGSLSQVAIEIPDGLPMPILPTGLTANNDIIAYGSGFMVTNTTSVAGVFSKVFLRQNTGLVNDYEIVINQAANASYRIFNATIQYFAQ